MLNYGLVKQLKDAGFPFKEQRCQSCIEIHLSCDVSILPPLSELIAACGLPFTLTYQDGYEAGSWIAGKGIDDDGKVDCGVRGFNPEEAVARLWLALNKK
jgi:hypothetical protein